MCEAVERHVLLSRPRRNGSSLYDNFEQVELTTGKWPKGYEPIQPPDEAMGIWDTFWELRQTVPAGMGGPCRISFGEIDAWQRVRGVRLGNFLVDIILKMDGAYMAEWNRDGEKPQAKGQASPKPKRIRRVAHK